MIRFVIAALLFIAAAMGLASQSAQAQQGRKPFAAMNNEEKADVKTAESVDAQYRNALERTRKTDAAEVKVDPWSNMRGTPAAPARKKP